MLKLVFIGIGGGIGSIFRYLASIWTEKFFQSDHYWATFGVNITGCLLIGFLSGLFDRNMNVSPEWKSLFITGFCGGYTTFSTFSAENLRLLQSGHVWTAVIYIAASIIVGLLAVWVGLLFSRYF
ncbi:MAG: fluoride efflux transporter CrcB [Tannerella sp.]|jgi:CrcB protein|nr:fluoride efflux transporter CrcB [Tannerella sp.]